MPSPSPALDQPYTFDYDAISAEVRWPHANSQISCFADRSSDLLQLQWAWSQQQYAHSVQIRLTVPQGDPLQPLALRFFPGYQETIYGSEGVVVSKRLFAPMASGYDQAALWLLECQAEGDWLVRVEVEIDWGAPLHQRIVDGLLVAQLNPGPSTGIYQQQNAESTRIFGTTQGRPDLVEFADDRHARLVYHLLITGVVEVPLILALSDVGEQMAWNGFLALREIGHVIRDSSRAWETFTHTSQVWTPSPALNHAVQLGKTAAVQQMRRLRTGLAPADQRTGSVLPLLEVLDTLDVDRSRELLLHLMKLAKRSRGKVPLIMPDHPKVRPESPDAALAETNSAYLCALEQHLRRHPDLELLTAHYPAVQLCAEALIKSRWGKLRHISGPALRQAGAGLRRAVAMARLQDDSANIARWESEAAEYVRLGSSEPPAGQSGGKADEEWPLPWPPPHPTMLQESPQALIALAGRAIWQGCGVSWANGALYVQPGWPADWKWWALLNLPIAGRSLSLLWNGKLLYATQPLHYAGTLTLCDWIQATGTDPDAFELTFQIQQHETTTTFRPQFG